MAVIDWSKYNRNKTESNVIDWGKYSSPKEASFDFKSASMARRSQLDEEERKKKEEELRKQQEVRLKERAKNKPKLKEGVKVGEGTITQKKTSLFQKGIKAVVGTAKQASLAVKGYASYAIPEKYQVETRSLLNEPIKTAYWKDMTNPQTGKPFESLSKYEEYEKSRAKPAAFQVGQMAGMFTPGYMYAQPAVQGVQGALEKKPLKVAGALGTAALLKYLPKGAKGSAFKKPLSQILKQEAGRAITQAPRRAGIGAGFGLSQALATGQTSKEDLLRAGTTGAGLGLVAGTLLESGMAVGGNMFARNPLKIAVTGKQTETNVPIKSGIQKALDITRKPQVESVKPTIGIDIIGRPIQTIGIKSVTDIKVGDKLFNSAIGKFEVVSTSKIPSVKGKLSFQENIKLKDIDGNIIDIDPKDLKGLRKILVEGDIQTTQPITSILKPTDGIPTQATRGVKPTVSEASKVDIDVNGNRITKAARDLNKRLVDSGLKEIPIEEQAKYTSSSYKKGAEEVVDLMNTNIEKAKAMAVGDKPLEGVSLPQILFKSIEKKAIQENDVGLIKRLANSPIATAQSEAGKALGSSGYINVDNSPVKAVKKLQSNKIEAMGGKKIKAQMETLHQQANVVIKTPPPQRTDWEVFIKGLECK